MEVVWNPVYMTWEAKCTGYKGLIPNWTPDEVGFNVAMTPNKIDCTRLKVLMDKKEKRMKKQGKKMAKLMSQSMANSQAKEFNNFKDLAPNAEAILNAETPEHTMKEIVIGLYHATLEMMKYAQAGSAEIKFGIAMIRAYNEYEPDDE